MLPQPVVATEKLEGLMKYLVVLSRPAGIGVVVLIALVLTRRPELPAAPRGWAGRPAAASAGPTSRLPDPVRLIGITVVGWIAAVSVMLALGAAWVVHDGSDVDRPVYAFAVHHRVVDWNVVTAQLTRIADLPESLVVAALAAVWLALGWDRQRWLPPVILATIVVVDHFLTAAIRGVFERVGPPNSPGGAYPSGGCERAVPYFGLIAYLFLHEVGWSRNRRIWVGAAVAAVALNEVYTQLPRASLVHGRAHRIRPRRAGAHCGDPRRADGDGAGSQGRLDAYRYGHIMTAWPVRRRPQMSSTRSATPTGARSWTR